MTTFFWSDMHFNHPGIAVHCPRTRKYKTLDEMNAWLIGLWNKRVTNGDRVFLLGDFAFGSKDGWSLEEVFFQLNGQIHLVRGNHDFQNPAVLKLPWETQTDLVTVKDNGMHAVCCHYPLETWDKASRGRLMLHGHSHGSLERVIPHRFDVGVDAEGFLGPITFQEIWERAQGQQFYATDHHGRR
jgi:calcineurin-like phosphoesterase family protein